MHRKIREFLTRWKRQGYLDDIPDEVLDELMRENLAPSWKQIAIAILRNDHQMQSLGFTPEPSPWYVTLKREEIQKRPNAQMELPF